MNPHPVPDAFRALLSRYRLPLFPTLTFAKRTHPEAALKAHHYAMHLFSQELFGRRYRQRGVLPIQGVAAIERQANWNPHVHSLVGHPDTDLAAPGYTHLRSYMRRRFEEEWGFSRLDVVTSEDDARAYVIDYAAKTGELYFSTHLEHMNRGQATFI